MHASKLHPTSIQRIWHIFVLAAFCLSLMLPSPLAVHAAATKIGLVTGAPLGDNGYNDMANAGLDKAELAPPDGLGIDGTVYESADDTEYAANLQQCVSDGNALCIGVGFTMAAAVEAAATANSGVNFAILDYSLSSPLTNLRGITFDEKQAGYLAGALAGKMTSSNVVGAVGGMSIPPVVAFLSGYQNGAQCARPTVSVLLNYTGTFSDPDLGASVASDMIASDADVIFGAAGPTGNGAILYSAQNGKWSIGVDADQYLSVFGDGTVDGSDMLLSSAMKRLDNAVYHTIEDQLGGTFSSGNVTYDLSNGGVGLAPYHETDSSIPTAAKTYINGIKDAIIAGTTSVHATCRAHSQVGLVTDESGMARMGFNDMAYQGLLTAQTDQGITPMLYQSASSSDYATNLGNCAEDGNDLCFAVSFLMADAIESAAVAYPDTHFAILDFSPESPPSNLRGITFNVKQAAYLAGALAGKMTASNVIGAIGGMQIPVVVDFMEGYQNGAQCANHHVNVLMNYAGTFSDPDLGAATAADMISRDADVIFAPAGPTGTGAIQYGAQNGTWSIGVDTDQYITAFDGGAATGSDKLLTSAAKWLDNAVHNTIADELSGGFTSGIVTYGLNKGGVGLAPYHDAGVSIQPEVQSYIDGLKQDIIDGIVDVNYACQPRFHAEIVENDVQGYDWYPGWSMGLTIDDPGNGAGVDVSRTGTVNSSGTVVFSDLGGLQLAPDMIVTMKHEDTNPLFSITKVHTITNLMVTGVDPAADTVSGTGPAGASLNIQRCDGTGCSWRRFVTIQPDNTWLADFSAPGGSPPEEQNILDIVPGVRGEALQWDEDGDHTDYQWYARLPIAPCDGVGVLSRRPTFDWNDIPGATAYNFQLSKTQAFSSLLKNGTVVGSSYPLGVDLPAGLTLWWRVRAKVGGVYGNWWEKCSFRTPIPPSTPVLKAPATGVLLKDYTPFLDWADSTMPINTAYGFDHYELELATNTSFTTDALNFTTAVGDRTASSYTVPDANSLTPNRTYYWHVRAVNTAGEYSAWSAARNFRTAILPPNLILPPNPGLVGSRRPVFDWDDVTGASSYKIQISRVPTFRSLVLQASVAPSTFTPGASLPAGTTLYWRVQAIGKNGPSNWSLVWQFSTP